MSGVNFLEKLLDGVGVEWKALKEVTMPTSNIKWRDTNRTYRYIDLTSVSIETKAITETPEITNSNAPSRAQKLVEKDDVIFATTRPAQQRYCLIDDEYAGEVASTGYCVLRAKKHEVLPKWILHWIASADFKTYVEENQSGSAYPAISDAKVKEFKLPIPCPENPKKSLAIQAEIVRILDAFTELTAELTARKKQYTYYRDQLLSFDLPAGRQEGEACLSGRQVEWKEIGELFPFIRNGFVGTVTPFYTDASNGIRYLQGTNIQKGSINDKNKYYVTNDFHKKCSRTKLKADDILVVQSGHVGECAVVGEKYKDCNCHALIVMSNGGECNSKFVNYFLQTTEGKARLLKITTGGTVKHILASKIKKLEIPVPSLAEQARIVAILDKFDALTHSITEGLPREIELRQKQYEYYRDLLLSFPKPEEVAA